MYELYPYFTNDGTVGLFSRQDDDIYHSTYGALTESWQKFIIPSRLEEYLAMHESVKILDICYGIGYNTKTALNVFVKQALKAEKNSKKINLIQNKNKKSHLPDSTIATIDADNIAEEKEEHVCENFEENNISKPEILKNEIKALAAIYTNNIKGDKSSETKTKNFANSIYEDENVQDEDKLCNNILIDAVDLDKFLMDISPFIADASRFTQIFNFIFEKKTDYETYLPENKLKYQQIKNIRNFKKFIKKEFRLKREVSIILLEKLFEHNSKFFEDKILQAILTQKKYFPFFSKFMLDFGKFCSNQGCNYNKKQNKSTFLHNIYYRYISKSYKNAQNLLKTNKIDLNFYKDDARRFIKSTNNKYNFIFLDAFTPSKCPALWSVQFFRELYLRLEDDGMILTYSNSAAVRNAFLQNGFCVGKIYDINFKKFVGTVATKNEDLIEHELNERDLDLINSKAGICFKDENLEFDNNTILKNREDEVSNSELLSSSQILKGYKNDPVKSL